MSHLALPPTHADFPHVALLHAICAAAARYSAAVQVSTVAEVMAAVDGRLRSVYKHTGIPIEEEIAAETCFAERNARYASYEMRYDRTFGRKAFEMVQAQVILGFYYQQSAKSVVTSVSSADLRWFEGYTLIGTCIRTAVTCGLMSDDWTPVNGVSNKPSLLDSPEEDWDREERRATMLVLLEYDAASAASSGWPNALQMDELVSSNHVRAPV